MKSRKTKELQRAFAKKGFIEKRKKKHIYYYFIHHGIQTYIHTRISHGHKDVREGILFQMAKQLFLTQDEFENLVDCPLDYEGLAKIYQEKDML